MYMILYIVFHLACDIEKYPLDVPAVDTHRPKPTVCVFDVYCSNLYFFKVTNLTRSQEQALENLPDHY